MNADLAKHLWRSPVVRTVLRKEVSRLAWFFALYVGAIAISRYIREKPIFEGVLSAAIGASAVALLWLISAIRTLRAVLREHELLER